VRSFTGNIRERISSSSGCACRRYGIDVRCDFQHFLLENRIDKQVAVVLLFDRQTHIRIVFEPYEVDDVARYSEVDGFVESDGAD